MCTAASSTHQNFILLAINIVVVVNLKILISGRFGIQALLEKEINQLHISKWKPSVFKKF